MTRGGFGGVKVRLSNIITLYQLSSMVVVLWDCFAASCIGILHKVDEIIKEDYLHILHLHLKPTARRVLGLPTGQ